VFTATRRDGRGGTLADPVGAQFTGGPRGVVDRVERILAALGGDRRAARVGPHDQRHPEPFGVLTHPQVLREVTLLGRRADIERVAHGVRAWADGFLHRGVHRRERVDCGRDVGLAVQLEHQRNLAGVFPVELPGQTDLKGDAVETALPGEPDDVPGVTSPWMAEEVSRAMLEPVVVGQKDRGSVPQSVLVKNPVQPGLLPGAQA